MIKIENDDKITTFDKSKDYSIEELDEIRSQLYDTIHIINKHRDYLEIKDYNYEKKFIEYVGRGCMYVTWQNLDKVGVRDGEMFFQGMVFDSSLTDYRDDSYFFYDALHEWRIPINIFLSDVKGNKIRVITKEEFISKIKEKYDILLKEINEMTEYIVKEDS